ncbi:MAG: 4-hydroxy-3-methylbut-2-enyl diphosphate reductase [Clostridiales bacterium]|nr:4-hydroxy-3-methylbut-2-enyl diphosphate reductase [Clostridiales bacterium]
MDIKLASTAGFCFGVKRAVDTVYTEIEKSREENTNIYTFGPIIHNEQVVEDLKSQGVKVIESLEELNDCPQGTVIIRSHGVSKSEYDTISKKGFEIIDATCPFVKKIHNTVFEKSKDGYDIIIIGNENHPEVLGIKGWSLRKTTVIGNEEEASDFVCEKDAKLCVVSQTTFNYKKFNKLVEILGKKLYDIIVVNTICNATNERQLEARQIASSVDTMIVIGGKTSSNTQKLYEICSEECIDTHYIQTSEDLKEMKLLPSSKVIGITAGASTPKNIIEEVQNNVRIKF